MKNIFKRSKPPVIFDDGKEKVRVPECFRFDSDETTDFGQQVVMLLTLQPNAWRIHPGLRRFWHPELGEFMFDGSDRVRHLGASRDFEMHYASAVCPHALSQGDHNAIVEALRFFLTRAMDIGIAVEGEPPEPQVFRGKPPAVARKGDLLLDQGTIKKYDGTGWIEQAAAVAARNPFSVGGVAYHLS